MKSNVSLCYVLEDFSIMQQDLVFLTLAPKRESSLNYLAGQYIEVLYPDQTFHPFSIGNAPRPDKKIELQIRITEKEKGLINWIDHIKKSKEVLLRGPYGKAYFRPPEKQSVLLLAGGTGFAYTKAIIEAAIQIKDSRDFYLYRIAKNAQDFYLSDLISFWQTHFLLKLSYTEIISDHTKKNVFHSIILTHSDFSNFEIYAGGPYSMVNDAFELLLKHGAVKEFFYSDMVL